MWTILIPKLVQNTLYTIPGKTIGLTISIGKGQCWQQKLLSDVLPSTVYKSIES